MPPEQEDKEGKTIQQQMARAKLRESFLRALIDLSGQPCSILNYEKTNLNATFAGWNADGTEILVKNLETPSNVKMNTAVLRTPDVIAIKFDELVHLS